MSLSAKVTLEANATSINNTATIEPLLESTTVAALTISETATASVQQVERNNLGVVNGVLVPCLLNIMGVIMFERLGWGVGQSGLAGALFIMFISELGAITTVLALSALISNGNTRGGGSYYMISRTLGPELGGSVGMLFYTAYTVGIPFYVSGFAEELVLTFYPSRFGDKNFVALVASITLFATLIVSLAGARAFTKVNVGLFAIHIFAIFYVLYALLSAGSKPLTNGGYHYAPSFSLLKENWWHWSYDTRYGKITSENNCYGGCTFQLVFGVLFVAVTGIMEGANLSGDLADPAGSIPMGTIGAVGFSYLMYVALMVVCAATVDREGLILNFTVMQQSAGGKVGEMFIVAGIFISTFGAALGSLFGGARILQAIARDELLPYMRWFRYGTRKGDEPIVAVLFTWAIAQAMTLIGSVNLIAAIASAFFTMTYATVNLSCFFMTVSGAPNWRPKWKYFSRWTCLVGVIVNAGMTFYMSLRAGLVALGIEIVVFVVLVWRAPSQKWGDVTQSIMFHQIRKWLLRLDERKMHSKLWRPNILLLADLSSLSLIDFCNTIKKGGLYVIGMVVAAKLDRFGPKNVSALRRKWMEYFDYHNIKAFPHLALAPQMDDGGIQHGYESLVISSGLGAMTANTIVLPLLKIEPDIEVISEVAEQKYNAGGGGGGGAETSTLRQSQQAVHADMQTEYSFFNDLDSRVSENIIISPTRMGAKSYVELCRNILEMEKNVLITANFESISSTLIVSETLATRFGRTTDPSKSGGGTERCWVDVWVDGADYKWKMQRDDNDPRWAKRRPDRGFPMLLMQLGYILLRNKVWKRVAKLRVFLIVPSAWQDVDVEIVQECLKEIRVDLAEFVCVKDDGLGGKPRAGDECIEYCARLNQVIRSHSSETVFSLVKLPDLFRELDDEGAAVQYLKRLSVVAEGLPPTIFVGTGETIPIISSDI